jgi:hypothetical protein
MAEAVTTQKVTVDNNASQNAPTSGKNVTVETKTGNGEKKLVSTAGNYDVKLLSVVKFYMF